MRSLALSGGQVAVRQARSVSGMRSALRCSPTGSRSPIAETYPMGLSDRRSLDQKPPLGFGRGTTASKRGSAPSCSPTFTPPTPRLQADGNGPTRTKSRRFTYENPHSGGRQWTLLDSNLACPEGLEPPTPSLEGWCSIQL